MPDENEKMTKDVGAKAFYFSQYWSFRIEVNVLN